MLLVHATLARWCLEACNIAITSCALHTAEVALCHPNNVCQFTLNSWITSHTHAMCDINTLRTIFCEHQLFTKWTNHGRRRSALQKNTNIRENRDSLCPRFRHNFSMQCVVSTTLHPANKTQIVYKSNSSEALCRRGVEHTILCVKMQLQSSLPVDDATCVALLCKLQRPALGSALLMLGLMWSYGICVFVPVSLTVFGPGPGSLCSTCVLHAAQCNCLICVARASYTQETHGYFLCSHCNGDEGWIVY